MLWNWATFRTDLRVREGGVFLLFFLLMALAFKWHLRIHDLKGTQREWQAIGPGEGKNMACLGK